MPVIVNEGQGGMGGDHQAISPFLLRWVLEPHTQSPMIPQVTKRTFLSLSAGIALPGEHRRSGTGPGQPFAGGMNHK